MTAGLSGFLFIAHSALLVFLYVFIAYVAWSLQRDLRSSIRTLDTPKPPPRTLDTPKPPSVPVQKVQSTSAPVLKPRPERDARMLSITLEVLQAGQSDLVRGATLEVGDPYVIGRSMTNDLALDDDWISAEHVSIRRHQSRWIIEDLQSTNGTRLNDAPVKGMKRLAVGDVIDIGRVRLKVASGI